MRHAPRKKRCAPWGWGAQRVTCRGIALASAGRRAGEGEALRLLDVEHLQLHVKGRAHGAASALNAARRGGDDHELVVALMNVVPRLRERAQGARSLAAREGGNGDCADNEQHREFARVYFSTRGGRLGGITASSMRCWEELRASAAQLASSEAADW